MKHSALLVLRIAKRTDYALRVLLYLSVRPNQRCSTQLIADAFGLSLHHLHKVVRDLGDLGLLAIHRGSTGGVELAKAPAKISVGLVVRAFEGDDSLVECFASDTDECVISPSCGLKSSLRKAQEAFFKHLDPTTIADLTRGPAARALRRLTGD